MGDRILYTTKSAYHAYLEVAEENGIMVLNTENGNYSFGNLHRVFEAVFRSEKIQQTEYQKILVLGLGGGSIIQLLRNDFGITAPITAIEIDPEIVRLSIDWFGINRYPDITIEIADASNYIENTSETFDLILTDLYIDLEVPDSCQSNSFLSQLTGVLAKNGKLIYNKVVTGSRQRKEFSRILKCLNELGKTRHYTILDANKVILFEHDI